MLIKSVAQIIGNRQLPKTTPHETVREACYVLDELNVGALAVLDGTELVGVISERDVIRKCICRSRLTAETKVRDIMTTEPRVISVTESLSEALKIMVDGGFRHLPVMDGSQTVGLLSMRDIPTEYRLMLERYNEYLESKSAPAAVVPSSTTSPEEQRPT